jgi:hypothetical protein
MPVSSVSTSPTNPSVSNEGAVRKRRAHSREFASLLQSRTQGAAAPPAAAPPPGPASRPVVGSAEPRVQPGSLLPVETPSDRVAICKTAVEADSSRIPAPSATAGQPRGESSAPSRPRADVAPPLPPDNPAARLAICKTAVDAAH